MKRIPTVSEYREYNPYTDAIITTDSGYVIVVDRYDVDDYGVWWTDKDHLYDDTFGCSTRGSFESILHNLKNDI